MVISWGASNAKHERMNGNVSMRALTLVGKYTDVRSSFVLQPTISDTDAPPAQMQCYHVSCTHLIYALLVEC